MKNNNSEPTKKDLFDYLDEFSFVDDWEIPMAVNDFFRDYVEKDENYQASYWELLYFQELAEEYQAKRNIYF